MFEWIVNHGVWLMGGGGLFTGLAALLKCFPAAWNLIVNAVSAPYWRGQARTMEALLNREIKRAEQDAEIQTKRYERLYAAYLALLKNTNGPAGSSGSSDASSPSTPNPSTKTPP